MSLSLIDEQRYLPHCSPDKGLKGTIVDGTRRSKNEGFLEIYFIVP